MYPITVVLVHNMPAGPGVLVPGPDADNPMPIGNGFGSHEKDSVFAHHFKGVLREGTKKIPTCYTHGAEKLAEAIP